MKINSRARATPVRAHHSLQWYKAEFQLPEVCLNLQQNWDGCHDHVYENIYELEVTTEGILSHLRLQICVQRPFKLVFSEAI